MPLSHENLDALLLDYIEGRATPEQSAIVREHLKQNPALSDEVLGMMLDRQLITSLPKPSAPPELADAILARLERNSLLTNVERDLRDARTHWWRSRLAVAAALFLMFSIFTGIILHGISTHDNSWTRWAENKPSDGKPGESVQLALGPSAAPSAADRGLSTNDQLLSAAASPATQSGSLAASASRSTELVARVQADGAAPQAIAAGAPVTGGISGGGKFDGIATQADRPLGSGTEKVAILAVAFQPASDAEALRLQSAVLAMMTQDQVTTRNAVVDEEEAAAQARIDAAGGSQGGRRGSPVGLPSQNGAPRGAARQAKGDAAKQEQYSNQSLNNDAQNYNVQNNTPVQKFADTVAASKPAISYPLVIHARLRPSQIAALTAQYHIQSTNGKAFADKDSPVRALRLPGHSALEENKKRGDEIANDSATDATITILPPG